MSFISEGRAGWVDVRVYTLSIVTTTQGLWCGEQIRLSVAVLRSPRDDNGTGLVGDVNHAPMCCRSVSSGPG